MITEAPGWRLWATDPGPRWRGHRLHRTADDTDLLLTLGHRPEHWLSLRHEPADRTWSVRTDRFATVHAYVGDGIVTTFSPAAWGDDPTAGLGSHRRLRPPRAGTRPTACRCSGVRLLRPATEERWDDDGRPGPARRWQGWDHRPRSGTTVAEAADALAEVLDEVLDQQADGDRLGLPISGGLDSRVTVASLTRSGRRPDVWPYSYGYDAASPELRIAGEVARARGLTLSPTVIPPYLFDRWDEVVDATEGLVDLTLCRQSAVAPSLRAETDAVVAAHWGDVWFGAPTPPPGTGTADALLAASTKRGHDWLTDHVVRPHLGHDPEPELRDVLAAEAARVETVADPTIRLLALKTEQWSLRWTQATLRAFQAATEPRLPFYDPRVADLALSLPAPLLAGRHVQIELLRRHAPDLARIEWQAVETDLFRLRHERTWRLPRRAVRHVARRLRPPTGRVRNWEVQLLEPAGRAGVDRHLVEPGAPLHDAGRPIDGGRAGPAAPRPSDRPGSGLRGVGAAHPRRVDGAVHVRVGVVGLAKDPEPFIVQLLDGLGEHGIDVRIGPDRTDLLYLPWTATAVDHPELFDRGVPVVLSCRGAQVNVAPWNPDRAALREGLPEAFARATAVHCVSEAIRDEATIHGLDPAKATVIRPAVDLERFRPAPLPGAGRLVSVGRLQWRKGYEWALLAVRRLVDRGRDVTYEIVGEEADGSATRHAVHDLGLQDRVTLTPPQGRAAVVERLQAADALLLPSLSEGIANAALEAMACGRPVVVTDCGGMSRGRDRRGRGSGRPRSGCRGPRRCHRGCAGRPRDDGAGGSGAGRGGPRPANQVAAFADLFSGAAQP